MLGHLVQVRDEMRPSHYATPLLPAFVRRALQALFRRH